MWFYVTALATQLKSRWNAMNKNKEAGYASEAVLTTALLVVGALLAIGLIMAKVNEAANDIELSYVIQSVVR